MTTLLAHILPHPRPHKCRCKQQQQHVIDPFRPPPPPEVKAPLALVLCNHLWRGVGIPVCSHGKHKKNSCLIRSIHYNVTYSDSASGMSTLGMRMSKGCGPRHPPRAGRVIVVGPC